MQVQLELYSKGAICFSATMFHTFFFSKFIWRAFSFHMCREFLINVYDQHKDDFHVNSSAKSLAGVNLFPLSSLYHFICIFIINTNKSSLALQLLVYISYLPLRNKPSPLGRGLPLPPSGTTHDVDRSALHREGTSYLFCYLYCTREIQLLGKRLQRTVFLLLR